MNSIGLGTRILLAFAHAASTCPVALAHAPARATLPDSGTTGTRGSSLDRRLDTHRFSVVVTNAGSLGFNLPNGAGGAWYPRGQDLQLLFASGLWLAPGAYGIRLEQAGSRIVTRSLGLR